MRYVRIALLLAGAVALAVLVAENDPATILGYLATLDSFRGAPPEALIRAGATSAVVRAEGAAESRELLIEAELALEQRPQPSAMAIGEICRERGLRATGSGAQAAESFLFAEEGRGVQDARTFVEAQYAILRRLELGLKALR